MLRRRPSSWPVVAEIVDSGTINNVLNTANTRERLEFGVQLVLAEETAILIVGTITRVIQLLGFNHFVLKSKLLHNPIDLCALIRRQACRLSGEAEGAWP